MSLCSLMQRRAALIPRPLARRSLLLLAMLPLLSSCTIQKLVIVEYHAPPTSRPAASQPTVKLLDAILDEASR